MKFKPYPKYKASGVEWLGDVPEGWEIKPIKSTATWNDDVLDEKTDPLEEIQYVDISSVDAIDGIKNAEAMLFKNAPSRARRKVRDGDVIVSTVRTYLRAIASIKRPDQNMIVSTGFAVLRPRKGLLPNFASYLFRASYVIEDVIARSTGVSYPAINATDLVRIAVAIPSEDEQSTIATFLDRETAKIDTLITKQEKLIDLLKEKRQAVISHAVTKGLDPTVPMKPSEVEWLGDVPKHWNVAPVKHAIQSIEQGWSPQCEGFPAATDEWGVLKVGCVNGGIFRPEENKTLPLDLEPIPKLTILAGDLLISRANTKELVGSAAVAKCDYPRLMLCDKLYRLRVNMQFAIPYFMSQLLGTSIARSQIEIEASGASASMLNIAQGTILELRIAFPPVSEQQAIVSYLEKNTTKIDTLIAKAQQAIALQKEHRTALISAAVTGKIDVRGATEDRKAA